MISLKDLATEKVTVISGPYGSGKTNVAVNLAMDIAKSGQVCRIADLDIVNPYFRSADNAKMLESLGVQTMIPTFANTNVDIPALPPNYQLLFTGEGRSVADVGGDGDGAAVLGMSHDQYVEAGYKMYFVYNRYRYITSEPEGALEVLEAIKRASGLEFHGIINNSNLGEETNEKIILDAIPYAERLSEIAKLPLLLTTSPDWVELENTVTITDITKKLF
ncbi:MAG: PhoH family protein [Clostridia bacterium]|nr:PhoH family protein [Clostridia bacterium]MBO5786421.1 PhoH family protein [Clostridia bacterium]